MNSYFELKNIFNKELSFLYSENEISSILNILIEFEFKKKPIIIKLNDSINKRKFDKVVSHLKKLKLGCPINYIIGYKFFFDCKINVDKSVLIPRPETEELVLWLLKHVKKNQNILDLCSGSGCISIAIAKNIQAKITAVDISSEAINLARENSKLNNTVVKFICSDIFKDSFKKLEKQNIIVSNPPYILNSQKKNIQKNVLNFEPHIAIFVDDNEPFVFYKRIIEISKEKLFSNGLLFLEINDLFSKELKELLIKEGFKNVIIKKDINDKPRLIKAQLI